MAKNATRRSVLSEAEELLWRDLLSDEVLGDRDLCREHEWHPGAGWRFDFAWPSIQLAVEVDGRGRHQFEKGEREDQQKLNAALEFGWRVLRYPARSVTTHKRRARIVEQIRRVVCNVRCAAESTIVLQGD